jgi:hypothetical protein
MNIHIMTEIIALIAGVHAAVHEIEMLSLLPHCICEK